MILPFITCVAALSVPFPPVVFLNRANFTLSLSPVCHPPFGASCIKLERGLWLARVRRRWASRNKRRTTRLFKYIQLISIGRQQWLPRPCNRPCMRPHSRFLGSLAMSREPLKKKLDGLATSKIIN